MQYCMVGTYMFIYHVHCLVNMTEHCVACIKVRVVMLVVETHFTIININSSIQNGTSIAFGGLKIVLLTVFVDMKTLQRNAL